MALKTIRGYILGLVFIRVASSSINIHNSISLNTRNALNNQNTLNTQNQPLLNKRIVNGIPAKVNQISYQVFLSLYFNNEVSSCGGTILTARHVVTASHCLTFKNRNILYKINPDSVTVKAGDIDLYSNQIREFSVEKVFVHPCFKNDILDYDVGVLKLKSELPLNVTGFKGINLANSAVPYHTKCFISGWGYHSENGWDEDKVGKLYYTNVYIIKLRTCVEIYNGKYSVTSRMICTLFSGKPTDSCAGDSGGPLTCNGVLAGIISWGRGCARPHNPGVYADVYKLREWILSKI